MNGSTTAVSLPVLLRERAEATPDRVYAQDLEGRSMTFGEFHHEALRWAEAFRRIGVGPGDNVLSMLPPSLDAILSWVGLSWLRAVEAGVNTDHRGRMLQYLFDHSGASVLVTAERYVARLSELETVPSGLATVVVIDGPGRDEGFGDVRVLGREEFLSGVEPATGLQDPQPWDVSAMIYTSGTTGPSKGVLVPWAHLHAVLPPEWFADLGDDEAQYSPFPMYHMSGKLPPYTMAMHNGRVVIREKFRGADFWDDIRRFNCTIGMLTGTMHTYLYRQEPRPDDRDNPLRTLMISPVLPEYEDFQRRFDVRLYTSYNMTELSAPIISMAPITDHRSCGRLRRGYPGYEVRVVDEHDQEVPVGAIGELIVRTDVPWTLNAGYFGMAEATASAWRNGWFHTGDAFTYDEDGNFYFVDRFKDAIRRRGENISSFEVESLVNDHPSVQESAAIGVPSEWGEDEVKVVVVRRPGRSLEAQELIDFLKPHMPRFMVPRFVEFVDELPKTEATQRVRKSELRKEPFSAETWDRELGDLVDAGHAAIVGARGGGEDVETGSTSPVRASGEEERWK